MNTTTIPTDIPVAGAASVPRTPAQSTRQAYQILHWGFTALPIIVGIDKFSQWLTNWDMYLAPAAVNVLGRVGISSHLFMQIVGVIEIAAGLILAFKPRIGAYIVAAWLGAIIVNLLMARGFYDIALRDFGLALGAVALARLSHRFEQ